MTRYVSMIVVAVLLGCPSPEPEHPWIELGEGSLHQIVEFSGVNAGQIVVAMDPTVSRADAMELGRLIQSQAPAGATVNARLYNDDATARGWRTARADLRVEHLLVLVSVNPATGLNEVRWVPQENEPVDDPVEE